MRAATSLTLLVLVASATVANLASAKDRPSDKQKQSVFLERCTIKETILFLRKSNYNCCCSGDSAGEWGSRPRVMLLFSNKAKWPLWLAVTMTPESSQETCEHRGAVDAKGKLDMLFTQDPSRVRGKYAVTMMAFADSAFADTVEFVSWTVTPK